MNKGINTFNKNISFFLLFVLLKTCFIYLVEEIRKKFVPLLPVAYTEGAKVNRKKTWPSFRGKCVASGSLKFLLLFEDPQ